MLYKHWKIHIFKKCLNLQTDIAKLKLNAIALKEWLYGFVVGCIHSLQRFQNEMKRILKLQLQGCQTKSENSIPKQGLSVFNNYIVNFV